MPKCCCHRRRLYNDLLIDLIEVGPSADKLNVRDVAVVQTRMRILKRLKNVKP